MEHTMDMKEKSDLACRTAEEFTKLYYDGLDKKRHLMTRYYLEHGALIWNGTGKTGKDEIQKFLLSLPTTEHTVTSIDAQPVLGIAVGNQITFLIQVAGSVRRKGKSVLPFQQNFIITAQGDKWKIVSDCYRDQIPVNVSTH